MSEKEVKYIGTPQQTLEAVEVLDKTIVLLADTLTPETNPAKCGELVQEALAIQKFKNKLMTETVFNWVRRKDD